MLYERVVEVERARARRQVEFVMQLRRELNAIESDGTQGGRDIFMHAYRYADSKGGGAGAR